MAKDTFYFSHDYNSRQDEKIKRLIRTHGMQGYGIFWSIVEDLYNNANALRTDYKGIAYDLHSDEQTIRSIINDFDLFVFEEDKFGSLSIQKRLDERNYKSKIARESALYRWSNANALQTHCEGNAIKERKGKEIKEKESSSIEQHDTTQQVFGIESRKSYDSMPEEFKKMYNKILYDDYIRLMGNIKQECRFLSKWENQITIYEFSKLYERIQNNEITPAEVRQALIDLDANKQAKDKYNSVMHGLNIYLKTIISKR